MAIKKAQSGAAVKKKAVPTKTNRDDVRPFQSKKDVGPQPPKETWVGGSPAKNGKKMKKCQTGGSLGDIYTGPAKTNPGVLKAQANKAKTTAVIKAKVKK